jgi:peptidoglycan/LPS O-acetylase OafA/YrhL
LFYTNRVLRLWPPILVISLLVITKFVLIDEVILFGLHYDLKEFFAVLRALDGLALSYLVFSNLFVFGQDLLWFVRIDPAGGVTYAPLGRDGYNGASFSLNHVLFTVAIEAAFYLISPFLLRRSVIWALTLAILGGLYHVLIWLAGLEWTVWGYHFFLSAAYFYFLGACAYYLYAFIRVRDATPLRRRHAPMLEPGLYLGALLLALLAWAFVPRPSMTMALVLAMVIPPLFIRTGRSVVDRFVGELSFGIYLTHYPIYLLLAQHLEPRLTGALTAGLAILAAIILYLLVDRPLDRWRQARARARGAGHPASGVTAASLRG